MDKAEVNVEVSIKHLQLALRFLREAREKVAQLEAARTEEIADAWCDGYRDGYKCGRDEENKLARYYMDDAQEDRAVDDTTYRDKESE